MRLRSSTALRYGAVVLVAVLLATAIGTFLRHMQQLKAEAESTFQTRSELLGKFVSLNRDRLEVMHSLLLAHYASGAVFDGRDLVLRDRSAEGFMAVEPVGKAVAGAITGGKSLSLTPDVKRQMRSAMAMDPQIRAALRFDSELAWLYFLSARDFIYIAPRPDPALFHFTPDLYRRGYWVEAGPAADLERRTILKGPYSDRGGKGWILTFVQPVYAEEAFLGIVAIDLKIDTLQKLTNVGAAIGETMMVSEHHRLIARQSGFDAGVRLHPPLSTRLIAWRAGKSGDLWLSRPVVKDELWLVHRVTRGELYRAAARESAGTWFMIALVALVAVISWRLRLALVTVTRIMRVDPLTQVLNRRGFYQKAEWILSLSRRKGLSIAVLLMDIDHFKRVNDSYGHVTGDRVLKQLGGHLAKACRPSDLVCRWGGEEFVVVLMLDSAEQALPAAERMRREAQQTRVEADGAPVTLSGGLTLLRNGETLDDAIRRADLFLYQAKEGGRNRIVAEA